MYTTYKSMRLLARSAHVPRLWPCPVDTELLCVDKSDFIAILYDTQKLQWDQVQLALDRFNYFNSWSLMQRQDCCTLAKIRQYEPLQTIYAEDIGRQNSVFFVLSGTCTILQCLKMNVSPVGVSFQTCLPH